MKPIRFKLFNTTISFGFLGNCVYPAISFENHAGVKTLTIRTKFMRETTIYFRFLSGQPGIIDWNSDHAIQFCKRFLPGRYEYHEGTCNYGYSPDYETARFFGQHMSI